MRRESASAFGIGEDALWESTRAAVVLFATAQHECELLLVKRMHCTSRDERIGYFIANTSSANRLLVVVQTLAFFPCNAAVLVCKTRCVSRYERFASRDE